MRRAASSGRERNKAALRLFHLLRKLDAAGLDYIVAEPVSEVGLGVAVMDRLRRAATAF